MIITTERDVARIKATGKHFETRVKGVKNLLLRVTPGGHKSWSLLWRPGPKRRRREVLGCYPAMKLSTAKRRAEDFAADIRKGLIKITPTEDKSFRDISKLYMSEHEKRNARGNKKSKWSKEAQRLLDADILPVIGDIDFEDVTKADVVKAIEKVAARGSYVNADKVLGVIRSTYNWANATGRSEQNPTIGLKRRKMSKERTRTLKDAELRTLWSALGTTPKMDPGLRDVYRLQLLLGIRVGEGLGAAQSEFDLDNDLWVIPSIRTKARREHRLPLSPWAKEIVVAALKRAGSSPWLFPSPHDGEPMRVESASRAFNRLSQRKGIEIEAASSHDLRRTCATGLGDLGYSDELIGRVLNHAPPTVTGRVYNHGRYIGPMREALDQWAKKLRSVVGA